jgi:hypothetical protein
MKERRGYLAYFALISCLGVASFASAQAVFEKPRAFVPARACSAYTSIKKQTEPVSLDVGKIYHALGATVTPSGFRSMLTAHPDVLERIREFTKGRVYSERSAPTGRGGYLDDLTEALFSANGFAHIFCGEAGRSGSVGGLHFRGRYLQVQRKGVACRRPDNRSSEEVALGAVYSVGVRIQTNGRFTESERKGYGLTLGADDFLKVVTRAFVENPASGRSNEGCLLTVEDDGKRFKAVFVRRNQGIRTFYTRHTRILRPGARPSRPMAALSLLAIGPCYDSSRCLAVEHE